MNVLARQSLAAERRSFFEINATADQRFHGRMNTPTKTPNANAASNAASSCCRIHIFIASCSDAVVREDPLRSALPVNRSAADDPPGLSLAVNLDASVSIVLEASITLLSFAICYSGLRGSPCTDARNEKFDSVADDYAQRRFRIIPTTTPTTKAPMNVLPGFFRTRRLPPSNAFEACSDSLPADSIKRS